MNKDNVRFYSPTTDQFFEVNYSTPARHNAGMPTYFANEVPFDESGWEILVNKEPGIDLRVSGHWHMPAKPEWVQVKRVKGMSV